MAKALRLLNQVKRHQTKHFKLQIRNANNFNYVGWLLDANYAEETSDLKRGFSVAYAPSNDVGFAVFAVLAARCKVVAGTCKARFIKSEIY